MTRSTNIGHENAVNVVGNETRLTLMTKKINQGNDLESQSTQISTGVRIRSSQKTNLNRVAAPIELSNSVHPATQTSGVPVSVKPGVTYCQATCKTDPLAT